MSFIHTHRSEIAGLYVKSIFSSIVLKLQRLVQWLNRLILCLQVLSFYLGPGSSPSSLLIIAWVSSRGWPKALSLHTHSGDPEIASWSWIWSSILGLTLLCLLGSLRDWTSGWMIFLSISLSLYKNSVVPIIKLSVNFNCFPQWLN